MDLFLLFAAVLIMAFIAKCAILIVLQINGNHKEIEGRIEEMTEKLRGIIDKVDR